MGNIAQLSMLLALKWLMLLRKTVLLASFCAGIPEPIVFIIRGRSSGSWQRAWVGLGWGATPCIGAVL